MDTPHDRQSDPTRATSPPRASAVEGRSSPPRPRGVDQRDAAGQRCPTPLRPVRPIAAPVDESPSRRLPLRTPAQAAQLLAVPESWLRRKPPPARSRAPSWANTCGSPRPIWPRSAPPARNQHPTPQPAPPRRPDPADPALTTGARRDSCGRGRAGTGSLRRTTRPYPSALRARRPPEGDDRCRSSKVRPQLVAGPLLARRRHPRLHPRIPHQEGRRGQGPGDRHRPRPRRLHRPRRRDPVLAEWPSTWFDALDVAPATLAQYRSLTRNHILPRWGTTRARRHRRARGQRVGQETPRPATPPPPSPPSSRSCR